ncbi:MAG: methyltransferase domain-containing protein [Porphyrobacter sp.]|nr:methyltransferase domain-containing protein [Porphyrobacter sp.]
MTGVSKRTRCRSCFAPGLRVVVDFGLQPLAGFYAASPEDAINHRRYPLLLEACPVCDLLQITDLPPIEEVFHDDYTYSSSEIPPLVAHFADYSRWLEERFPKSAAILEFGCNDGVLLNQLRERGYQHLTGVDASTNMVARAASRGFDVIEGFFGSGIIDRLGKRAPFDLITCSNVFAHIDDLQDVLGAAHKLLGEGGQMCIEVHDAEKLVLEGQFETIYHEHLTYFSEGSLRTCLTLNGFDVSEIEKTPMHGGGLRARARKVRLETGTIQSEPRSAVEIERIGNSLTAKVKQCRERVNALRAQYGPLDGYGMAGRAQMFLAMTQTEKAFGAFFDDAQIRQNRYAVGTDERIEAFSPERAARACVILAWNYSDAILKRIEPYYETVEVMFPEITKLK